MAGDRALRPLLDFDGAKGWNDSAPPADGGCRDVEKARNVGVFAASSLASFFHSGVFHVPEVNPGLTGSQLKMHATVNQRLSDNPVMDLGKAIKAAREAKDLTQVDVAKHFGITKSAVNQWESGKNVPDQRRLADLARLLGMEASVLIGTNQNHDSVSSTQGQRDQIDAPTTSRQSPGTPSEDRLRGTGRLTGDVREDPVEFRWMPGKLPVFAATDMGGGIVSVSEKPSENDALPRFAWDIPGVFGIFTVTEEMSPAYERGDRPLVNPSKPVREGDDVLILTGEVGKGGTPRAALRRLVGVTPTHWRVKQWNPPKVEKFDRKEWPIAFRVESKRNR